MKLGMSLLVCNSSLDLIESHIYLHSPKVDIIACIANNPSIDLVIKLKAIEVNNSKFKYLGGYNCQMNTDVQIIISNILTNYLKEVGCTWVIPCDDDEFYIGDIRECLTRDINVAYASGFCFYSTILDNPLEQNPLKRISYRDPDETPYQYHKAIHRTKNFKTVERGNHTVCYYNEAIFRKIYKSLVIHHYSHREKLLFTHNSGDSFKLLTYNDIIHKKLVKDETLSKLF